MLLSLSFTELSKNIIPHSYARDDSLVSTLKLPDKLRNEVLFFYVARR